MNDLLSQVFKAYKCIPYSWKFSGLALIDVLNSIGGFKVGGTVHYRHT